MTPSGSVSGAELVSSRGGERVSCVSDRGVLVVPNPLSFPEGIIYIITRIVIGSSIWTVSVTEVG